MLTNLLISIGMSTAEIRIKDSKRKYKLCNISEIAEVLKVNQLPENIRMVVAIFEHLL